MVEPGAAHLAASHDLTEVIEGDLDAFTGQPTDGGERVVEGLPGHEPVDHPPGDRRAGDHPAQAGTAGGSKQGLLGEHGASAGDW